MGTRIHTPPRQDHTMSDSHGESENLALDNGDTGETRPRIKTKTVLDHTSSVDETPVHSVSKDENTLQASTRKLLSEELFFHKGHFAEESEFSRTISSEENKDNDHTSTCNGTTINGNENGHSSSERNVPSVCSNQVSTSQNQVVIDVICEDQERNWDQRAKMKLVYPESSQADTSLTSDSISILREVDTPGDLSNFRETSSNQIQQIQSSDHATQTEKDYTSDVVNKSKKCTGQDCTYSADSSLDLVSAEYDFSSSCLISDIYSSGSFKSRDAKSPSRDEQNESASARESKSKCWNRRACTCVPLRFVVMCAVFVGMVIVNAMRTNVGVTVLTILNKEQYIIHNVTAQIPDVNWNTIHIGFLHSAFYLGYLVTHLPAGYLTTRLPSHKLFACCILLTCSLNLTLPVAIDLGGYSITLAVRFLQGLCEGLLYPACYGILRHWSTPPERGRVGALVLTGAYLGPAVGFPVSGVITDYLGWQYIYYVNGGVGVVYVVVWVWLSEEKPAHHKQISDDELTFIEDMQGSEKIEYENVKIPWSQILMSLPVLSLCLCNFARNWVFILLLTNEPFYLNMFNFSIAENGLYSALPHVFKISAALSSGVLADTFLKRRLMSTTMTRKLLTTGFGVQALFFVFMTQTETGAVAMVLLTVAVGFGGFVVSGWQLNHYDLSPRHASLLVAVTSTFGNLASISAPVVVGIMTDSQTFAGWDQVFCITCGVTGLAWITFLAFGSGERQPWAVPVDTAHLSVKSDTRRRSPSSVPRDTISASTPIAYTFKKLIESDGSHVARGHVPDYGSQQSRSLLKAVK